MLTKDFLFAGHAIFTLTKPDQTRMTFRIMRPEPNPAFPTPKLFASVLMGPDNTSDYRYLGMVIEGRNPHLHATQGTRKAGWDVKDKRGPFKTLDWVIRVVVAGGWKTDKDGEVIEPGLPPGFNLQHAGRCGRCGRLLTVPESIEMGIGPECAGLMGIENPARTRPADKSRVRVRMTVTEMPGGKTHMSAEELAEIAANPDARD